MTRENCDNSRADSHFFLVTGPHMRKKEKKALVEALKANTTLTELEM